MYQFLFQTDGSYKRSVLLAGLVLASLFIGLNWWLVSNNRLIKVADMQMASVREMIPINIGLLKSIDGTVPQSLRDTLDTVSVLTDKISAVKIPDNRFVTAYDTNLALEFEQFISWQSEYLALVKDLGDDPNEHRQVFIRDELVELLSNLNEKLSAFLAKTGSVTAILATASDIFFLLSLFFITVIGNLFVIKTLFSTK